MQGHAAAESRRKRLIQEVVHAGLPDRDAGDDSRAVEIRIDVAHRVLESRGQFWPVVPRPRFAR